MKKLATSLAMIMFALPAAAQTTEPAAMPAGIYKSDPAHTSVTFKVSHMGLSFYTARFTKAEATLDFNPATPANSKLTATVDPRSIQTDFPDIAKTDFNAEIGRGGNWLNGDKFPAMTFASKSITQTGPHTGNVLGDFTMRGVTKPLVLEVTFNGAYAEAPIVKKPKIGFSATTTIKRSDWGMNNYVPMIGDDVQVIIETELGKEG